jgi:hypothetical protein
MEMIPPFSNPVEVIVSVISLLKTTLPLAPGSPGGKRDQNKLVCHNPYVTNVMLPGSMNSFRINLMWQYELMKWLLPDNNFPAHHFIVTF